MGAWVGVGAFGQIPAPRAAASTSAATVVLGRPEARSDKSPPGSEAREGRRWCPACRRVRTKCGAFRCTRRCETQRLMATASLACGAARINAVARPGSRAADGRRKGIPRRHYPLLATLRQARPEGRFACGGRRRSDQSRRGRVPYLHRPRRDRLSAAAASAKPMPAPSARRGPAPVPATWKDEREGGGAERGAEHARGRLHAAGAAGAGLGRGGEHGAVVGRHEGAEARAAERDRRAGQRQRRRRRRRRGGAGEQREARSPGTPCRRRRAAPSARGRRGVRRAGRRRRARAARG